MSKATSFITVESVVGTNEGCFVVVQLNGGFVAHVVLFVVVGVEKGRCVDAGTSKYAGWVAAV